MASRDASSAVIKVVVISLLIDLLAFTLQLRVRTYLFRELTSALPSTYVLYTHIRPLPLFPRIIQSYILSEKKANIKNSLLSTTLRTLSSIRERLLSYQWPFLHSLLLKPSASASSITPSSHASLAKYDTVLIGGALGSLFSLLQTLVSPFIGGLSDTYGRRNILLLTMVGNILSALVWLFSSSFELYLLSRIVGGLSEGNVQLSIAIISDVTTPERRARSLALVGICFAVAFTFGPPIGAFLSQYSETWKHWQPSSARLTEYSLPAFVTLVLLLVETAYIYAFLPETKGWRISQAQEKNRDSKGKVDGAKAERGTLLQRRMRLLRLERLLLIFSFIFSGAEFTLTFLTFDLFSYTSSQNGRLLGSIGILSSLAQGGIVRRTKMSSGTLARSGLLSCVLALFSLAYLPISAASGTSSSASTRATLALAALSFAWSSASVVNSLNALASLECDDDAAASKEAGQSAKVGETAADVTGLPKGKTMGRLRSRGQLGRGLGPVMIAASYWSLGPSVTYCLAAGVMLATWVGTKSLLGSDISLRPKSKAS